MDEVYLTEMGQSQLTQAVFPIQAESGHEIEICGRSTTGRCEACDDFHPLDELGLCERCGTKMDRDFIRQRQWDYSVSACFLDHSQRERLRAEVIRTFGEKLELIFHPGPAQSSRRKRRKRTR
jgi:hypothetical protein